MDEVSARDLRNHTATVLRRAAAGERLRVTVSRRPVAELGPLQRPTWISGEAVAFLLRRAPADERLLTDLEPLRAQVVTPK